MEPAGNVETKAQNRLSLWSRSWIRTSLFHWLTSEKKTKKEKKQKKRANGWTPVCFSLPVSTNLPFGSFWEADSGSLHCRHLLETSPLRQKHKKTKQWSVATRFSIFTHRNSTTAQWKLKCFLFPFSTTVCIPAVQQTRFMPFPNHKSYAKLFAKLCKF